MRSKKLAQQWATEVEKAKKGLVSHREGMHRAISRIDTSAGGESPSDKEYFFIDGYFSVKRATDVLNDQGISALPDHITQVVVHSRRKGGFFSIIKADDGTWVPGRKVNLEEKLTTLRRVKIGESLS